MYAIYLFEMHTLTMIIMQQMACASRLPEKISKTDSDFIKQTKETNVNILNRAYDSDSCVARKLLACRKT